MNRRDFLLTIGAASAWPLGARAKRIPKIGLMFTGTPETTRAIGYADDFRAGLKEHGLIDGENVAVEIRYGEHHPERLPDLATELVRLPVDILVGAAESFDALRGADSSLPVVSAGIYDPVAMGVVQSFAHPGGRITGIGELGVEYLTKRLDLLKRTVPQRRHVGLLLMRKDLAYAAGLETAARSLDLGLRIYPIDATADFEPAMVDVAASGAGLAVGDGGKFTSEAATICALAFKHRLPSVSGSNFPAAGMMLGYGSDVHWQFRRAGYFVARILGGADPGDLPFERPPRFITAVNLKTAAALGIDVPHAVLAAADEVIE